MKLVTIEMSLVTALFRTARLRGQPYLPHIVSQLARRYQFGGVPQSLGDLGGDKAEFKHGLFEDNATETLEFYNDGVVVSSRSDSDFIDKFMDDLGLWLEKDHGLSVIETHTVNKMYASTLLVETEGNILGPLNEYAGILQIIENALRESSGLRIKYHKFGFTLSADQSKNPALRPIPFRFERKEGIEFSRNQFHTTAPLKTKQHLKILEQLDKLV